MINRVSCQNQKAWSSALFQQERMQKVWNRKKILMKMRTKRASAVTILSFFINERGVTATPPFTLFFFSDYFSGMPPCSYQYSSKDSQDGSLQVSALSR